MSPTTPFRTSPSTIARYFFHDCERFLYYSSADPRERQRQGLPEPDFDNNPVVAALLRSGFAWEEEVIERPLRGRESCQEPGRERHRGPVTREETPASFQHLDRDGRTA